MKRTWNFIQDAWCYVMHPDPMWPVNGQYRCPSCQRLYPVPWETGTTRWNYRPAAPHNGQPAGHHEFVPDVSTGSHVGAVRALKRLLSA